MIKLKFILVNFLCLGLCLGLEAQNVNMQGMDDQIIAKGLTIDKCYKYMKKACSQKKWDDAIEYGENLTSYRPKTPSGKEALYFLGIAHFEKNNLEKANEYFTAYLTKDFMPEHFEEVIEYKFKIAEKYRLGVGKPLFGSEKMPNWIPAEDDALKIYDEVINALPQSEMAIKSLFNKAQLHFEFAEYKKAAEAAESLISKYPKHALAIESFLLISKSYFKQADPKHHENDLLNLAEINLAQFKKSFPLEERTKTVEEDIKAMKEVYAEGLFEVAQFYNKKKESDATALYFRKIKTDFPNTKVAGKIRELEQSQK